MAQHYWDDVEDYVVDCGKTVTTETVSDAWRNEPCCRWTGQLLSRLSTGSVFPFVPATWVAYVYSCERPVNIAVTVSSVLVNCCLAINEIPYVVLDVVTEHVVQRHILSVHQSVLYSHRLTQQRICSGTTAVRALLYCYFDKML